MGLKLIGSAVALLFVAACQTAPVYTADVAGEGGAAGAAAPPAVAVGPAEAPDGAGPAVVEETPPAPGSVEEFVEVVGDRVFFPFDRFDLLPHSQDELRRQAEWLNLYPAISIIIEGHCDERGTREYNLALGERRANAVRNFLVALGVDGSRIETVSYGKERPAAVGSNITAWALNRRGVTKLEGAPAAI